MRLYRTSVKEDLNVGSVFQHLAENYVDKVRGFDDDEEELPYFSPYSQAYLTSSMQVRGEFDHPC